MTGDGRSFVCCAFSGEFAVGPVRSLECATVSVKNSSNTKKNATNIANSLVHGGEGVARGIIFVGQELYLCACVFIYLFF
jgi:hypothetical protein